ncbi:hypothetical protein MAPG_07219 [Magnaporthiopsis poae ATCC 64411]|uniref:C2H2-type domain-containing protein n=1 Tax=Magnaporthiopsis poae (strain ATCC 64411 / 73-15) TaxID=644358 RepID=A0A0C4E431_MAGP6|nr:hypothetical protein MAPG_07219 [Magnaporthiopsis poae ATCC 64411]
MPDYGDEDRWYPEPARDQTTKDASLGLEGLPFRTKPAVANEDAQNQTGPSPAPVVAAVVATDRPPSPPASVALLGNASPREDLGVGTRKRSRYEMKKSTAGPLIIPGPRISASRIGVNDDQASFSTLPRTDTLTSVSTESTGTPITPLRRSNTEFSTSSITTVDTSATSPTGSCDTRLEYMYQAPPSLISLNPHAHITTSSAATPEFGSVVSDAKAPMKSSMSSKAQDVFGPDPKSERSVRWADMETPKPLAPRKTMPISQGLGESSIEAPKPLVSHGTFPITAQELTACAADVSSSLLRGASPGTEKAITDASGPKRPPTRTLSLTQLRVAMMEAGLSGEAESEDRVIKFIQACQSQTVRGMTESEVAAGDAVMASNHPIGPEFAQPRTPERSMASAAASTPTPEREGSPTAQWTPSTSSDEGSDQDVYSSVMCEELGEKSQDQFIHNIYAVILQHTPGAVLDELDQSLKELAVRCVERAANLAQTSLNKRASAVAAAAAAAEFSGDSLQQNNEPSPCDGPSSTHPANADGNGASFGQGQAQSNPRKRPNDSLEEDSDDDGSSQGDGSGKDDQGGGTRAKKTRTGGILSGAKLMSCPYRKRNPLRFNIRDHESCATQGHADMARLKRHIKIFHDSEQGKVICKRCRTVFKTDDALERHQTQDKSCNLREKVVNTDPENGITKEIEARINDRKKGVKVDTWEALWGLLFPQDIRHGKTVPKSDFVPPVELFEVRHEFDLGDGEVPPLKSMREDCQRYVERKFDICINDPTKKRERQGDAHVDVPRPVSATNSLPVFGSAGAPAAPPQHSFATPLRQIRTAPLGQPRLLQQLTPELTPVTAFPSHTTPESPSGNRQNYNGDGKLRTHHGSPPLPSRIIVGMGAPPPSKYTATSNLAPQSTPPLPPLAPRLDSTAKAKEKAASSALQVMPSPPTAAATNSYQSHVNGMVHNNTNCGLNLINSSIMAGEMSDGRSQMDDWPGMIGASNTMSPVAAGKQPEGRMMRRQSSSADTAIYNPNASPPQQQQQQPGSYTPDMNGEQVDSGDGSGLLVRYASGGVADMTNNAAMFSPSQVLVSTAAPTTMAMVTASSCPSFPIPAGCDEPFAPMPSNAIPVDPFDDFFSSLGPGVDVGGGPAVTSEGDMDFSGMSEFMPGVDQPSAHAHAQPQNDGMVDDMEFTPGWPNAGARPSGF